MSGSGGDRQQRFRLIVPVLVLALPAILLIGSVLPMLEPAPPTVQAEEDADVAALLATSPGDELAIVVDTPLPETAAPTPLAFANETPVLPTAVPTLLPMPRATATPRESWMGPQTFTFVALGVDLRNEGEIPRTDTIMIGRVDLREPKVSLVSIPRDLLVEIPGYGKDRINTAYVYGELFKEPGGGIGLLKRTIEKSFGVTVDHFALIDFQCFRTAVDAVGGVTVNVPRKIVDPHYPTEDYGTKLVEFEPGIQRMDGERALEYARTRYADNDFQRIQRQQLIVAAMREQMLSLRTLPSIPTMLSGCQRMRTDLAWRDYLALGTSLQSLNSSRIAFASIDEKMAIDTFLPSGAEVLMPKWELIRPLVAETFGLASGSTTRTGPAASPAPALAAPSPSPIPYRSPVPLDASIVKAPTVAAPPDDGSVPSLPASPMLRRS